MEKIKLLIGIYNDLARLKLVTQDINEKKHLDREMDKIKKEISEISKNDN